MIASGAAVFYSRAMTMIDSQAQLEQLRAEATTPERQIKLAQGLFQSGRHEEAREMIARAAEGGDARASLFAGVWMLVGIGGPVSPEEAAVHLRRADAAGDGGATFLLSTLAVNDMLGPRDWDSALQLLLRAAAAGYGRAATALAMLIDADAPVRAALFERGARGGDPLAQYFYGRRLLDGADTQRAGIAWLSHAARSNEPCSQRLLAARGLALDTAPLVAAPPPAVDWAAAGRLVRWPHQRAIPPATTQRDAPRVASIARFLDSDECDYLMSRGSALLRRATAAGASGAAADVRTNDSMKYGVVESDPAIQSIDTRIAAALGARAGDGERLALLRYRPGQHYAPHFDWIDPTDPSKAADLAAWGQRIKTLIVYLNDDFEGGETSFPRAEKLIFRGERGDALMWDNLTAAGAVDPLTLHAGLTPATGEKWLLSLWLRDRNQGRNFT